MTEQEFIATDPALFGGGNSNLFYSSSISGSDNVPVAPFTIMGMSLPFAAQNSVNIKSSLKGVTKFKFQFGGAEVLATIIGKQQKNTYTYFSFDPVTVTSLPSTEIAGNQTELTSEFVFLPYVDNSFFNDDYNPLQGNAESIKPNSATMVVDRNASQTNPSNLQAILNFKAAPAQINDSQYTTAGYINGRYLGSKETSINGSYASRDNNKQELTAYVLANGIAGNEPALAFKKFVGSIHTTDTPTATIKDLAVQEEIDIFFNSVRIGVGSASSYPNFPPSGSILYTIDETSGRCVKAVTAKVFVVEQEKVLTSTEAGGVSLIE